MKVVFRAVYESIKAIIKSIYEIIINQTLK